MAEWLKAGPGDQARRPRRQAAGEGSNPRKTGAFGEYLFMGASCLIVEKCIGDGA
jgi:hypothetical protein